MLRIKKKYRSKSMSSGKFLKFNTNDLDEKQFQYYFDNGFAHIFDVLCDKCEKVKCICND